MSGIMNLPRPEVIDKVSILEGYRKFQELADAVADLESRVEDLESRSVLEPTANRRLQFDSSMSANEIQSQIDALPKFIPYGYTYKFRFLDGTYTMLDNLVFGGFFGGGMLYIIGNEEEAGGGTQRTTQGVVLNFSSGASNGIYITACTLGNIFITDLKITSSGGYPIRCDYVSGFISCLYNYLVNDTIASGAGVYLWGCENSICRALYFYKSKYGIYSYSNSQVRSQANDSIVGNLPDYGLYSRAAIIRKNGSQPAGATANELTADGGQIV